MQGIQTKIPENQMERKLKFPTFPSSLPETWIMLYHSSLETEWQIQIRIFIEYM